METPFENSTLAYVHDLKQFKAFAPCDSSLHCFVLQDFNSDELHLKVRFSLLSSSVSIIIKMQHNQYVFVSRRAIFFEDGLHWIFWCSCDKQRTSLITSLSHHIEASYGSVSKGECLHITAAMFIVEQIDAIHGLSPINDFTGKPMISLLAVCVYVHICLSFYFRPYILCIRGK